MKHKITAKNLIASMLEDQWMGGEEDRAGGPSDMWRQGGNAAPDVSAGFTGKRPGEAPEPKATGHNVGAGPNSIGWYKEPDPVPDPEAIEGHAGIAPQEDDEDVISQVLGIDIEAKLAHIKEMFVAERVNGMVHPDHGERLPPMSQAEAEAAWVKAEPHFRATLTPKKEGGPMSRFNWQP